MSNLRSLKSGISWSIADSVLTKALNLIVFIILARLLTPEAFGLIALTHVFLSFIQILNEQGFKVAVIQREHLHKITLDTAFWGNLLVSTALAAMTFSAAPLAARIFAEPELVPVIQTLSLILIIRALSSIQTAVLQKNMRFNVLAKRNVVSIVIGGGLGIYLAIQGFGVWSLIVMELSTAGTALIVLWIAVEWRPGFQFEFSEWKKLFNYGIKVVGVNMIQNAGKKLDVILIGLVFSSSAAGTYKVAFNLIHSLKGLLINPMSRIALPWFSTFQSDNKKLQKSYFDATGIMAMFLWPTFAVLGFTAPVILPIVLGTGWEEAIPLFQILCILGAIHSVTHFNAPLFYSIGRPGKYLSYITAAIVLRSALLVLLVPFGAIGVAIAVTFSSILIWPFVVSSACRMLSAPVRGYWKAQGRILGAVAFAVGTTVVVQGFTGDVFFVGLIMLSLLLAGSIYTMGGAPVRKIFSRFIQYAKPAT